jgi:hypothetical protein
MGALGAAILAKKAKTEGGFDVSLLDKSFETEGSDCKKCANRCELINIYRAGTLIDTWGARCS